MPIRITHSNINSLSLGTYFDAVAVGLVLRVGKKKRTWQLRARVNGPLHQKRLGAYPAMGIADAREAAREAIRRIESGLPPTSDRRRQLQGLSSSYQSLDHDGAPSFGTLLDKYETYRRQRGTRVKALAEAMRHMRVNLRPWLDKPACEVSKADIREARNLIAGRGKLGSSDKLLAYLSPVFRWAAQEDLVEYNFIPDIVRLGSKRTRDRFLDDSEIALLWQGTHGANTPSMASYCRLLRFLLLTGQRLGEAATMDWRDVTGSVWHQVDNKAGRPHAIPITDLAWSCMGERDLSGLVFAGTSGRMSGWSKLKRRIDERCRIEMPWQVHDLRRSCASGMQRLGVDREVIGAVLNHAMPGITSLYMRDKLEPQKRAALTEWSDHVAGIARTFENG